MGSIFRKFRIFYLILIFFNLLIHNIRSDQISKELQKIKSQYIVSFIGADIVQLTDRYTGSTRKYFIGKTNFTPDLNSANLVIDVDSIDTSIYEWKYRYWTWLEVCANNGSELIVGDLDNDGWPEIAGTYINPQLEISNGIIYELNPDSTFSLKATIPDSFLSMPFGISDFDGDGIKEMNFFKSGGPGRIKNYECFDAGIFQIRLNFEYLEEPIYTNITHDEKIVDLDQDGIPELLHMGIAFNPVTDDTMDYFSSMVSEYDSSIHNLSWKFYHKTKNEYKEGFAIGDFDMDGKMEYVTGSLEGNIDVIECVGKDLYQPIWHDSLPMYNAHIVVGTNDIDGNGKPEFFIGTSDIGYYKIQQFETIGNNQYTEVANIIILGAEFFGLAQGYAYDVDVDDQDELVLAFSNAFIVLKAGSPGQFEIFYAQKKSNDPVPHKFESINFLYLDNHVQPLLFLSLRGYSVIYPERFVKIYAPTFFTNIRYDKPAISEKEIFSVYPNPLNSQTNIGFDIEKSGPINFILYDNLGKEVRTLVRNQSYNPGHYRIQWDGKNNNGKEVSSGIYYLIYSNSKKINIKKLIILK